MGKMKKKYTSGQATTYISRNSAIRKLQLSLSDFRRLCILKGIFPVEPKSRKKANKGVKSMKTFYFSKDIKFLANEPILQKYRELKIFARRIRTAKAKREMIKAETIKNNMPIIRLDHIIRERYPQFTDALNDLDDCICLVLLFANFPVDRQTPSHLLSLCRRLFFEFLHYVVLTKSLRKCFISIKGFYMQADICGQSITWIMPHKVCHKPSTEVDFRIMRTFLDFYVQLLGFVNFKLFTDLNMQYPPKISYKANSEIRQYAMDTDFYEEMLCCLAQSPHSVLSEQNAIEELDTDSFTNEMMENSDERMKRQFIRDTRVKKLFQGLRFFINREVPREIFSFVIRCCGGEVSWNFSEACGSTYPETDTSITHQVIDRPLNNVIYPNREYVQPQWIFDCVNAGRLLKTDEYAPGCKLPAHRSPFVSEEVVFNSTGDHESNDQSTDIRLLPSELDSMNAEERKLRELMIPRKLKRIYKKAVHSRKLKRRQNAKNGATLKKATTKKDVSKAADEQAA